MFDGLKSLALLHVPFDPASLKLQQIVTSQEWEHTRIQAVQRLQ